MRTFRYALTDRLDRSGHIEADPAGQIAGEKSSTQGPVRWVEPARMNPHADLPGARIRHGDLIQAQHVRRFAILMETERLHSLYTSRCASH
jgi:hypothetical protein